MEIPGGGEFIDQFGDAGISAKQVCLHERIDVLRLDFKNGGGGIGKRVLIDFPDFRTGRRNRATERPGFLSIPPGAVGYRPRGMRAASCRRCAPARGPGQSRPGNRAGKFYPRERLIPACPLAKSSAPGLNGRLPFDQFIRLEEKAQVPAGRLSGESDPVNEELKRIAPPKSPRMVPRLRLGAKRHPHHLPADTATAIFPSSANTITGELVINCTSPVDKMALPLCRA